MNFQVSNTTDQFSLAGQMSHAAGTGESRSFCYHDDTKLHGEKDPCCPMPGRSAVFGTARCSFSYTKDEEIVQPTAAVCTDCVLTVSMPEKQTGTGSLRRHEMHINK